MDRADVENKIELVPEHKGLFGLGKIDGFRLKNKSLLPIKKIVLEVINETDNTPTMLTFENISPSGKSKEVQKVAKGFKPLLQKDGKLFIIKEVE